MKIIESARKHGISNKDIEYVYISATQSIVLREDPEKVMLFGFDTIGRALEIGYIINDQGTGYCDSRHEDSPKLQEIPLRT
jgi:hypothetical protein